MSATDLPARIREIFTGQKHTMFLRAESSCSEIEFEGDATSRSPRRGDYHCHRRLRGVAGATGGSPPPPPLLRCGAAGDDAADALLFCCCWCRWCCCWPPLRGDVGGAAAFCFDGDDLFRRVGDVVDMSGLPPSARAASRARRCSRRAESAPDVFGEAPGPSMPGMTICALAAAAAISAAFFAAAETRTESGA